MLTSDIKKIDFGGKNFLKSHIVNLDTELDCVVLLSVKDQKLRDLLYNKIIDALIDRVHPKNAYKDFSNALENINAFLSNWKNDNEKIQGLHAIIGIYHGKTFLLSTIGKASCYLYNTHGDIIEVTDKWDSPKDFSFISSGEIASGESLILTTLRLLDILSKDDIKDGLSEWNITRSSNNIEHILLHEHTGKNIGCISLKKEFKIQKDSEWKEKLEHYVLRIFDNTIAKKLLWYLYHVRDSLLHKSQKTKQVLLGIWIIVSIFFLYYLVSWFVHLASSTQDVEWAKQELLMAQGYIAKASDNMNDVDAFSHHIEAAEEIIVSLEKKQLFLTDIETLKGNMGVLQKQFNGIESFETKSDNTVYTFETPQKIVKVLSISNKIYVVHKNSITGPILPWEASKNFIFEELSPGDYFIDATVYETNIILMTYEGKVVNFAKNNYFSYLDVADQPIWDKSTLISSYGSNLYLLSDEGNQILRHKKQGNSYDAWVSYLKDEDAASVWKILSLAIDGGIYILKSDGSVVKLFRSPEYRFEWIVLNNLPRNYDFKKTTIDKAPSLRARANLRYVYMLFDNKVLVFQPNTTRYQDVKSLNYIGQIEWKDIIIEDLHVDNDGEIFVAAEWWVYRMEFDISEDELIVK